MNGNMGKKTVIWEKKMLKRR